MTSKALSGAAFVTFSTLVLTTHPRYEETQNGWCCFLHNDNSVQSRLVLKLKLLQDLNPQCMLSKKVRELKQLYCLLSRKTKKKFKLRDATRRSYSSRGVSLTLDILQQNALWRKAALSQSRTFSERCVKASIAMWTRSGSRRKSSQKNKTKKKQAQMLAASIKTQEFREPPVDLYRACEAIRVKASRKLITSVAGCPGKWKKKKRASVRNVGTLPFQTKGSPHLRFAQT